MGNNQPRPSSQRPSVSRLAVKKSFDRLTSREKLYAHYMARAAWHGTGIIFEQVSRESSAIFNYIMELYHCTNGNWPDLSRQTGVPMTIVDGFLEYAALFLSNVGSYYGKGDQKIIPWISKEDLGKISSVSKKAKTMFQSLAEVIFAQQPRILGFPSDIAQSSYYLGSESISREEIALVSQILEDNSINPENTRICKTVVDGKISYDILQASVDADARELSTTSSGGSIRIRRSDHSLHLERICECLEKAREYAANPLQEGFISKYLESFRTGDLEAYKESQRMWVKDVKPSVETVLGFVEPYRDPFGIRAEFEGLVGLVDAEETKTLTALVENSTKFIRRLPWAEDAVENDGKGPFENSRFEAPDFTSLHALAYCSSIIFPGINLPNYNDIRQNVGSKNLMIANSIAEATSTASSAVACIDPSELARFLEHKTPTYYLWVVFHELLGHGTGKLLTQEGPASFNFDIHNPPLNPLTNKPITSWYHPGQTWTGLFGDIATSVDECRAECVGAYLMSDPELLGLFGYTSATAITPADLEYNMYLQLGVAGLRALEYYTVEDDQWGQAHSRAHFGILKTLLAAGDDFLTITTTTTDTHSSSSSSSPTPSLTVRISRDKIPTHGKPALGALLLRLHLYRCTANVTACRTFYHDLTRPSDRFLDWRRLLLLAHPEPKRVFVQPNTWLRRNGHGHGNGNGVGDGDGEEAPVVVELREYEETYEGVIRSWAERGISLV